jgi:ferredoxin
MSACDGRAIRGCGDGHNPAECFLCLNCAAECPTDALGFELLGVRDAAECAPDLTRRGLILSIGSALVAIPLLRGTRRTVNRSHLIRPPGAGPEDEFLAACIRCGSCTRICPTGAIHSSITEAGLEGFWTPILVPRSGYCVYSCTLCGQVCPSHAIRRLGIEEKMGSDRMRPVKIGTAAVNRNRCIAWSKNMPCLACEEVCPVSPKAIGVDEATVIRPGGEQVSLGRPIVDSRRCIGCGRCEYVCPVEGAAAIRVFSAGETRAG